MTQEPETPQTTTQLLDALGRFVEDQVGTVRSGSDSAEIAKLLTTHRNRSEQITKALTDVNELRNKYSWWLLVGVIVWTVFVFAVFALHALGCSHVSKEVVIAVLGTGGATIWASFNTAAKYVFSSLEPYLKHEVSLVSLENKS